MLVLELLGTLSLRNETPPVPVSAQQKRSLGLLAILALAGRQGFSRDRIEAYLWPESSGPLARHSLDQTVYSIRHALGSDFILSTARELRLNPELVQVDAWEFEEAIRARQWAEAVDRYRGALLAGIHITDSREFEAWVDSERARLREEYQTAVEFLANAAAESGDRARSVTLWRTLANSDPLSTSATKKLMLALAGAGDRVGAVKQARLYQQLVRQELEIEPDPEVESLAATLSSHAIAETTLSPFVGKATQDESRSADDSAEAPNNPSITPAIVGRMLERKNSPRRERMTYAVIPIAMLMTAAAMWGWMHPAPAKQVVRYSLVFDSAEAMIQPIGYFWGRLALSPDGSRLAYVGGPYAQIMVRERNQLHATVISGSEGAQNPFFSPDGRRVGFVTGGSKLQIASLSGGPLITVTDSLIGLAGASWGRDGYIYIDGRDAEPLIRVEAKADAVPKRFTSLDTTLSELDHSWPEVLPNGKGILIAVGVRDAARSIGVVDMSSRKRRTIVNNAVYARYVPTGHLLYVTTDRTLMVVPFDQNTMKVTGDPTALVEGVRLTPSSTVDLAVSANGTLLYTRGLGTIKQELVWVTRDGKAQPVDPDWQGTFGDPSLSPDGRRVAVSLLPDASYDAIAQRNDIWIRELDRGPSLKLTLDEKSDRYTAWTPDGRSVTYTSNAAGSFDLWTKRVDGSTQAVLQVREKRGAYSPRWSPDGKWLVYRRGDAGHGDILGFRPGIDTVAVPLVATKSGEIAPAISPNGRWLAYSSNESGQYEVYVVPFPNTAAAKWAVSRHGGTEPVWSHSGKELFYRDVAGNLMAVEVRSTPTFSPGRSTVLFPAAAYFSWANGAQYAVAPDDRRFIMIRRVAGSAPEELIVVDNWFEELKAKSRK